MSTIHEASPEIWLVRHGETEWSLSGQHTGRTDIALTASGRKQAERLQPVLAAQHFDRVLCSPLQRAQETCQLAGLREQAQLEPRILEWNYGIYEGRKTADIRQEVPGWSVWDSPIPEGENLAAIERRVNELVEELAARPGRTALFAHAHVLRVLASCWISGHGKLGAHLVLGTASVSRLGLDRGVRVIEQWNALHS